MSVKVTESGARSIQVMIVDDHDMFREGFGPHVRARAGSVNRVAMRLLFRSSRGARRELH